MAWILPWKVREKKESLFDDDAASIRAAAINYLMMHRDWYAKWTRSYGALWNGLTCGIIILSAASSIVSAYEPENYRWIPVILSAVTALFGTLLIQFRVRDLWQIREQGRIDCEELVGKAHLITTENPRKALEAAIELRLAAHKIERFQTQQFFAESPAKSMPSDFD